LGAPPCIAVPRLPDRLRCSDMKCAFAPGGAHAPEIGEKILWQPDYDSWTAFSADVEATDEFRYAMAAKPEHAALFAEEDLAEET